MALVDLFIRNTGERPLKFNLYPLIHLPQDSMQVVRFDSTHRGYVFTHYESTIRLHSNLYANRGYPTHFRNILSCNLFPDSYGTDDGCDAKDFYFTVKRLSKVHAEVLQLNEKTSGFAEFIALQKNFQLSPGESVQVRFVRGVQDARVSESELLADWHEAVKADIQQYLNNNIQLFHPFLASNLNGR